MAEQVLNLKTSGNIKGAVYDADTQTLKVEFFNGGSYSYSGVDGDKALEFERSDSPGKFLHSNIKGQHLHSKI